MNSFWNDLYYEDIHFRDNLQFEVESDFAPIRNVKKNVSTQEFYFFIPSALQIDPQTYSKEQFYKDRTNLIRYKTPEFTFRDLLNLNNPLSPLMRIQGMKTTLLTPANILVIQDELKLLGNIVRSALRMNVRGLIDSASLHEKTLQFCKEVGEFRKVFLTVKEECAHHWSQEPLETFSYVDEFISSSIDYYLTGFLEYLRASKIENIQEINNALCERITLEKKYRQEHYEEPDDHDLDDPGAKERILYHKGLLNKYVLDALRE